MRGFWAKTPLEGDVDWTTVHTVLAHMLDVGLVFERLATQTWPSVGAFLTSSFVDQRSGLDFLCALAALHDVGKISPGFQSKVPALASKLAADGLPFPPGSESLHSRITMEFLVRHLGTLGEDEDTGEVVAYAQASACHHGDYFPFPEMYDMVPDSAAWEEERIQHLRAVFSVWNLSQELLPFLRTALPAQWTTALAGLISVADWVGSSLPFVSVRDSADEYARDRRSVVAKRISETGLESAGGSVATTEFGELFGDDSGASSWTPNETQSLVASLTTGIDGPFLAIVEAPTGIGKSEAALYSYALRSGTRNKGLYFALPTMATTNAMFDRVESFLERLYRTSGTQLRLLQSEARHHEGFRQLLARGANGSAPQARVQAVAAYEWFAGAKKGLLAEHAVGTIDQIMLAAMLSRHHFVRLLGLVDKIVVVDEIHAYDTYMQAVIATLLRWLRALDTPVVLLSATIPKSMRAALIEAYSGETVWDGAPSGAAVTVWSEDGVRAEPIPGIRERSVRFRQCALSDRTSEVFVNGAVEAVLRAVERGGCIACIVNTVDEAQEVFERLDADIDDNVYRVLLHARFTRSDRAEAEQDLQERFGPRAEARPRRAVVVGTQVLEQSLDVDFDYMVTDLAPIDLLIQRLGRVHRHQKRRPSVQRAHSVPTIEVLLPPLDSFLPRDKVAPIYEPAVLARSALAVAKYAGAPIVIPGSESALIEDVYGEKPIGNPALEERLNRWDEQMIALHAAERFAASVRSLAPPDRLPADLTPLAARLADMDDWSPSTRLGAESQTAVVLDCQQHVAYDRLVDRSLRVSSPRLVRLLRRLQRPPEWNDHWFLRRCVPLDLRQGFLRIEGYQLSYSRGLGLKIAKEESRA